MVAADNRMLERVVAILDAVNAGALSTSELARRTGLATSTTHRLAVAMTHHGLLRRDDRGGFELGARFRWGAFDLAAQPVLDALRDQTGETAQVWVRSGDNRVCVAAADSPHELRVAVPPSGRLPLPMGSAGQLLTGAPGALERAELDGWYQTVSERTQDQGSVSAPIAVGTELVAVLCLAMPASRITSSPGEQFGDLVAAAARRIADQLRS